MDNIVNIENIMNKQGRITAQDITRAKLQLFKTYFPSELNKNLLESVKYAEQEEQEEQEIFIELVERLLVYFPADKRAKLPDGFLEVLWSFAKYRRYWRGTLTWCAIDPFCICTDICPTCDSFDDEDDDYYYGYVDPWSRVSWSFEDLIWLTEDEDDECV